jgi:hypothetical protein
VGCGDAVFCGDVREQGTGAFLLTAHPLSAVAPFSRSWLVFQQPPSKRGPSPQAITQALMGILVDPTLNRGNPFGRSDYSLKRGDTLWVCSMTHY